LTQPPTSATADTLPFRPEKSTLFSVKYALTPVAFQLLGTGGSSHVLNTTSK